MISVGLFLFLFPSFPLHDITKKAARLKSKSSDQAVLYLLVIIYYLSTVSLVN